MRLITRPLSDGGIEAEVAAGYGEIRRLDLGQTPNTLVSVVGGPQNISGRRSIDLPPGSTIVHLSLRRVHAHAGVLAQIVVTDGCGAWSTFVGRGTGR